MDIDKKSEVSAEEVRGVIEGFLADRMQAKLDSLKKEDDDGRQKISEKYKLENWVADASKRVSQIQQATHPVKFVHPSIKKCTSLVSFGNPAAGELLVGTQTLKGKLTKDVAVENAAALDVYKFLTLDVGGVSILDLAVENRNVLRQALTHDEALGNRWVDEFEYFSKPRSPYKTHTLAKQIFWPVENGGYHLLAPLFPTSLVHQVWSTIREDRFSETTKDAREARKKELPYPHGYREYPNLAIQKFGGTKPQNISQLNSERYGENHLLPSLPPQWNSDPLKPPLKVESVFDGPFGRRRRVRELVKTLREFLYSVQDVNSNIRIRNKRIELMGYLVDEVLLFAAELRELDALWSLHPDCKLNIDEQCWLNPERAKTDPEFSAKYTWADWQENVCKRFASWLNAQLSKPKKPLPFDDNSARQWRGDMESELNMLRMEVAYYD